MSCEIQKHLKITSVTLAEMLRTKHIHLSIVAYTEIHRQTAALPTVFDLIEYSLNLDIPNEVMNNSII
jgi:hypothetical protein